MRHPSDWTSAVLFTCGFVAAAVTPAGAQLRAFDELVRALPQASAPDAYQIRVRWRVDRPVADPAAAGNQLEVMSVERVSPGPSRDRRPEVGLQHLVVISHDAAGKELDWRAIVDPRLVRSESASGGELRGENLYYLDSELVLVVPALRETAAISLYKVVSQNGVAALSPFARVAVPRPPFP
jgi:hypothetical protein